MADIRLTEITKSFGSTQVLNGIDLSVRNGEFLTLVGPSGCGKSTLLRIIAGLEDQDGGDVVIGDRNVNRIRASARDLAMVFQSYALYPHLTVQENMLTPLRLRDLTALQRAPVIGPLLAPGPHMEIRQQVQRVAKVLKIGDLLHRKPGQLSGGQRQRVALGRAMVRNPVAFLMDEPLSNLDAALRVHMRAELAELHRALGVTFIYVTHDQAEALTMSNRMAVMMGGDLLQLDAPRRVYEDPVDIRVAEFIGSPKINLLPGVVNGAGHVMCEGVRVAHHLASVPGEVTVGIRPEYLGLRDKAGSDSFTGRLVHAENLGADVYLHLSMRDGDYRLIARAAPEALSLPVGAEVNVGLVRGAAMVFGRDGRRLRFAEASQQAEVA